MFKYINIYFTCGIEAGKHYYGAERAKKAILMRNAIDVERFRFNIEWRTEKRKEFRANDECFVIGHVGRFSAQKNHSLILEIFKVFTNKYPASLLVLVGEEDSAHTVRTKAEHLGIIDKVRFMGSRSDIPQLLSGFDCILMPSLFEGVSVAMIEEQASGVPLITSTNVPKEVGLLPSTEFHSLKADVNEWVDAIAKYSTIPRIADAGEIITKAGYDIKVNAKWLQEYYLSLR